MARIAISLSGEERGYASQNAALVERMPLWHDVRIFAATEGFELFTRRFPAGGAERVTGIPGIVFQYTAGGLDNLLSSAAGFHFQARQLGPLVDQLPEDLWEFGADLAVTDFEPGLPLALAPALACLVAIVVMNRDFDGLCARQSAPAFAAGCFWLYFMYATLPFAAVFIQHRMGRLIDTR